MVTYQDLSLISSELTDVPRMVKLCQDTVNALLETNECCVREDSILSFFFPTDYNRARSQLIAKLHSAESSLKEIRRSTVSPEAIRAISHIAQIRNLCISCEHINRMNLWEGKKFRCQMQEKYANGFRFELDKEGRIIEKL